MSDGRPYRPAKGETGDAFQALMCGRCRRDAGEGVTCTLLIRGLLLKDAQLFPGEWVESDAGPSCTAFVAVGVRYRHAPPAPVSAVTAAPAQLQLAL